MCHDFLHPTDLFELYENDKIVFSMSSSTENRLQIDEKLYECDTCGKSFTRLGTLRVHLRTHSCENSHECEVCERQFNKASVLKKHLLTHTGEKPHRCAVCGNGFCDSSGLKRHLKRVHTSDKPQ